MPNKQAIINKLSEDIKRRDQEINKLESTIQILMIEIKKLLCYKKKSTTQKEQ